MSHPVRHVSLWLRACWWFLYGEKQMSLGGVARSGHALPLDRAIARRDGVRPEHDG